MMAKQRGGGGRRDFHGSPSLLTRAVNSVFAFVRLAEFEILFVLFFLIAYIIFKDLAPLFSFVNGEPLPILEEEDEFHARLPLTKTSRPEYNQILVKKPGGPDWWPY